MHMLIHSVVLYHFIPLGIIFILCITFCNAKLNNIGDRESPSFNPVLFSKKDDCVPSILTAFLVFFTRFTYIYKSFRDFKFLHTFP